MLARRLVPGGPFRQAAAIVVIGFWPPLFAMIGTIWRDVHLTLALLVAIALLLGAETRPSRWRTIAAGALVAYASAVRVNALLSVIPLACWVAWQAMSGRADHPAVARRHAASIMLVLAVVFGGRLLDGVIAPTIVHPEQCLQGFDLVGISARTGTNLVPGPIRNGNDRPERIASFYTAFAWFPAYWGPLRDGLLVEPRLLSTEDPATLAQIRSAWWGAVRANPAAYLSHRGAVFAANMGWSALPLYYPYERGVPVNNLGLVANRSRFSEFVYRGFDFSLAHWSWMWRPWIFLWADLVMLAACLLAGARGVAVARTTVVLSSALLYTLPYLVVAPAAELRYHHWPMAATFVALLSFRDEGGRASPAGLRAALGLSPWRGAALVAAVAIATLALAGIAAGSHIDFGDASPRPERAVVENNAGVELLGSGKFDEAERRFRSAAGRDPHWWVPETNLALAAAGLGHREEAAEHHDRAVRLDRAGESARLYRGEFRLSLGRWSEARDDFEAVRAAGRDDYLVNKEMATTCVRLRDVPGAVKYSLRCADLDPSRFGREIVEIAAPFFESSVMVPDGVRYFESLRGRRPEASGVLEDLARLHSRGRTESH